MDQDIDFIEILSDLGKRKGLVLGVPFIFAAIAAGITFLLPVSYMSRSVIMPPPQAQNAAGALAEQLGSLASIAGIQSGVKSSSDLYVSILKSYSVRDFLAEKLGLDDRFHSRSREDTVRALGEFVNIALDKQTGLISIEAEDRDPKFAAELANGHVEALRSVLGRLQVTDAQKRRIFFEKEVNEVSVRPFRDVRVQQAILEGMIRQYEIARIDEARESPMIQQVDIAFPSIHKAGPKRKIIVLSAFLVGFIMLSLYAIVQGRIDRNESLHLKLRGFLASWGLRRL